MCHMEPGATDKWPDSDVSAALDRLRRGAIEYCVLSLLRGGTAYSHDVVRALASVDGLVTSEGTLYPLLSRLRREGLVTTEWQESHTGPPRRYYQLTDQGRRAAEAFSRAWETYRSSVDTIVAGRVSATVPAAEDTSDTTPAMSDHKETQ